MTYKSHVMKYAVPHRYTKRVRERIILSYLDGVSTKEEVKAEHFLSEEEFTQWLVDYKATHAQMSFEFARAA